MVRIKVKKLVSLKQKLLGLMFVKKVEPVYLETRYGLHTFFVYTPIDILILDNNLRVSYIKENLKPWRIYLWDPRYFRILELPEGYVSKKGIKIGTTVNLD